jgi:hypothetical protein
MIDSRAVCAQKVFENNSMRLIGRFFLLAGLLIAAQCARAQVASQFLSFSIVGEYEVDSFQTNVVTDTTNQAARIRGVWIGTTNVVKAIAIDLEGLLWQKWAGANIVRETDMATGTEGIFLRLGAASTNVSSFFGTSYLSNFKENVPSVLGFSNMTYYSNGVVTPFTNSAYGANLSTTGANPTTTNVVKSADLFSVSLNTSNLKFNLLAFGTTSGTNIVVNYKGTHYQRWVDFLSANGVGNFAINLGTNLFFGTNLYETTNFVSGPARGLFSAYGTVFNNQPPF